MDEKEIELNPEKLREDLIFIYSGYLMKDSRDKAIEKAKELDGLWSGDFLLEEGIRIALNNLTNIYVKPIISEKRIKGILSGLLKNKR